MQTESFFCRKCHRLTLSQFYEYDIDETMVTVRCYNCDEPYRTKLRKSYNRSKLEFDLEKKECQ